MGLLLYKRYVPVLLALAVSGTGSVTAGAASHGGSGTAGVGVTADTGKHAGRGPEQKPAADAAGQDGDRNPGGSTGSGQSTAGGVKEPGSSAGSGNTDGSGGESDGSDKDPCSGPDDNVGQESADSGGADGSVDGNSGTDTDNGTGTDDGTDDGIDTDDAADDGTGSGVGDGSSGDGTAGSGGGTGSDGAGDGRAHENDPDIQSGNENSGPERSSGQQKEKTAEQRRDNADPDKKPDGAASGSGDTAAEMPETESRENCGPESGEASRENTGMFWAAFLAVAAAVLAGSVLLWKRCGLCFHGILTDQKKNGIRVVRSRDGTDVSVPALAGKLSSGAVSFQDYKELLMGSGSATILPYGTKMTISVTDGENAGTVRLEDADECRMLERLGEIADTARSLGKAAAADVVLWHDRKDFEIRIHYVFR